MSPKIQQNLVDFLRETLPGNYYVVANGDFVEVHEEVKPPTQVTQATQITFFDNEGY